MLNQNHCIEVVKQAEGMAAKDAAFSFILMKKFLVFIFFLFLLIAAEYYFLTEIFTQKRLPVLSGSLVLIVVCMVVFVRFFRKSVLPLEKHS